MLVGLVGVVGGCETPTKPMAKQPIAKPLTATMGNQGGAQPGGFGGAQPGAYGGTQSGAVQQSGFTGYNGQPGMNGTVPAGGVPSVLPGSYQGGTSMSNVRTSNYLNSPSMANANGQ